jgi:xanthine dehydrogenase accessory factor
MSRGHETDYQILRWLLRTEADYIGCIGSSKKIALTKERLLADGLSSTQIARMHAPVGLAIGAETPAEIAVSIAAELIRHRSCKNAK